MVVFVLLTTLTYYTPANSEASGFVFDSASVFSSLEQDIGLLDGNRVDEVVLRDIDDMTPEEIAEFFNLPGDVCINFESLEGEVILLDNGGVGVGLNGSMVCGG